MTTLAAPLLLAAAAAASAPVEAPGADWQVQHCGRARGTLWLTYIEGGTARITPAVATAAVRRACAAAGYSVDAASGPTRTPPYEPALPRGGSAVPPAAPMPRAAPPAAPPSFSARTVGDMLAVDARNDGQAAWRCTVNFSWTADDDPLGARPTTVQATVAAHQAARVATVSGQRNVRLVAGPSAHCVPE